MAPRRKEPSTYLRMTAKQLGSLKRCRRRAQQREGRGVREDDGADKDDDLSPLGRAERVRVRPPFKPCVRISRTRLTRWSSGRGMRHPRILNRPAQANEPQGLEEGTVPRRRPTGASDESPRASAAARGVVVRHTGRSR